MDVGVGGVANVGRDVHVEAREIRIGVEEIVEILPADDPPRGIEVTGRGECCRGDVGEPHQVLSSGVHLFDRVGKREIRRVLVLLSIKEIDPADVGAILQLRVAVCTAEALHHGRPGRELREQDRRGDVHTRLHRLGGYDDQILRDFSVFLPVDGELVRLASAIGRTKARVDESELRRGVSLLLKPLPECGMERLRPRHPVDDYQRHTAGLVHVEHGIRELTDIGGDVVGLGGGRCCIRTAQGLLRGREPPEPIVLRPRNDLPKPIVLLRRRIALSRHRRRVIHGPEPRRIECRGDPQAACRAARRTSVPLGASGFASPKRFELGRGCASRAHELHFVEHPLRVFVEKRELHRPDGARRSVAAHERAAQQHVLRPDDDRGPFGTVEPACRLDTAHEHVDILVGQGKHVVFGYSGLLQLLEPLIDRPDGLIDQRAHRQAPDEPSRRRLGRPHPMCCPTEGDGGRFSRARRRNQDLRPFVRREPVLPSVGVCTFSEYGPIDTGAVHACPLRSAHVSIAL